MLHNSSIGYELSHWIARTLTSIIKGGELYLSIEIVSGYLSVNGQIAIHQLGHPHQFYWWRFLLIFAHHLVRKTEKKMNKQKFDLSLFWIGFLYALVLAGIATWSLAQNLRTLTAVELGLTIWNMGGPLFLLWAFSVPLGSLLAVIGAFLYVKTKPSIMWLTGIGFLAVVIAMILIFSREYYSPLFGIGGVLILIFFFSIVWLWMKQYAMLDMQGKIAGSYKLIGYLFWMNASWFLCGEFGSLHQKAFEGRPAPSPIEIMVFLVLGWFFVLLGEYKSRKLKEI